MSSLKPHEQRVVDEKDELGVKLNALYAFIKDSPIFKELPGMDQGLLDKQYDAMTVYYTILEHRIAKF